MSLTAGFAFADNRIALHADHGLGPTWKLLGARGRVLAGGDVGAGGLRARQLLEGAFHMAAFERMAGVGSGAFDLGPMAPLVSVAVGIALAGPGLFDVRPFMQPLAAALPLVGDEDLRPLSDALIAVRADVQAGDQLGLDHSLHALRYVLRRLCQDRIGGQG